MKRPDAKRNHLPQLKTRRKRWLQVHLWLGLTLGLFLSIFGITGSILVFHAEINELLNPKLLMVTIPDGNPVYQPLAEIFQAGQSVMPQNAAPTFAHYPHNNQAAFKLSYSVPLSAGQEGMTESFDSGFADGIVFRHLHGHPSTCGAGVGAIFASNLPLLV